VLGRLIGSGGSKLRDLQARTSCHIFVVDKEVPPGRTGETRAVVLVGPLPSLSAATQEVESVVEARPPKRPAAEAFSAEDAIREAKRRFYGS
jgi:rRNA processing protein Krr1/Pno1